MKPFQKEENRIKRIFISNVLEACYRSYENLPSEQKNYWSKYDMLEGNRALLYDGDNKAVITYSAINKENFKEICHLAGWKNVINIYPKRYSISICLDLISDRELNSKLVTLIKNNPGIEIIPYRHTPEFYKLIENLREKNLNFSLPETMEKENRFIESYFHSKRGFRHLWEVVKDPKLAISIPMGFITANLEEIKQAALYFFIQGKDFLIKYNRGIQGIGIYRFNIDEISGDRALLRKLNSILQDKIWKEGSAIVEECIDVDYSILGGSPSVEMRILPNGWVVREYACEQILDKDGATFRGVAMNKRIENSPMIRTAFKAAKLYGEGLSKLGYRGYFDMDLVISKDKKIYAVESNLRRTGGTHINDYAKEILGKDYARNYYLKAYERIPRKKLTYKNVRALLSNIYFEKGSRGGVFLSNPDFLKIGILNLIIVGQRLVEVRKIEEKLKKLGL